VELVRIAVHLYDRGVSEADGGDLGFEYKGRPVKLADLAAESKLRVTAFTRARQARAGGSGTSSASSSVPATAADAPHRAHVSYVFFPAI
jgi:hypothetical protein